MMTDANIGFRLRALAAKFPDRPALIAPDVTLSAARLWRLVDSFAFRMAEAGIGRDARIGLATDDCVVSIATMFAAALVGAEFTTVDHFLLRVPSLRPTHFLRSVGFPPLEGLSFLIIDQSWSPASGAGSADGGASWPGYATEDAAAWIVHSSGTTGQPKFMRLSAGIMARRVQAVQSDYPEGCGSVASLFLPGSRPFLIRAAAAILSGVAVIDSHDPAFLQRHQVGLVTGAPRLVRDWLRIVPDTITFPHLQCSGARLSAEDLSRFLQTFAQVHDVYGSSETIKAYQNTSILRDGQIHTQGRPAAGSTIEIVDESGTPCPPHVPGTLRIQNAFFASGYVDDPEATARSFVDGWFYPGDLACWREGGQLDVQGRKNDVINLGGVKIALAEIDRLLSGAEGVARGVAFRHPGPGLQDALAAVVELAPGVLESGDPAAAVARAHAACRDALGPDAAPRDIAVVTQVPMTEDGMPRRGACQDLFRQATAAPEAAT